MICPFCEHEQESDDAATCPHCDAALTPRARQRYGDPAKMLRDLTARIRKGEVPLGGERAEGLFSHITGVVQQLLDHTREDLEDNFKDLRRRQDEIAHLPDEAKRDVLEFVAQFGAIQAEINSALGDFAGVLRGVRDPLDFEQRQSTLDYVVARMQNALERLEVLAEETSHPILTTLPDAPLPDALTLGISSIQSALGAVGQYFGTRDDAALAECVRHLDAARERIGSLLAGETAVP
ncbi:MAG: hypothetical protein FJX76_11470 [Armatimonadetes bacterium]|nr:hypothetical protein [Armatimonadota bacterium]